jgi:hypothetical protein
VPKDAKTADKPLEVKINISKALYDEATQRLTVNGWRLVGDGPSSVVISTESEGVLGEAEMHQPRIDVAKKYPEYNDENAGWTFDAPVTGFSDGDRVRATLVFQGGTKPFERDITIIESEPDAEAEGEEKKAETKKKRKTELLFTKAQYFPDRRRILLQAIMVHGSPIQKIEFISSAGRVVTDDMIQVSHPEYGTKVKWNVEMVCPALVDREAITARIVVDGEEMAVRKEIKIEGKPPHRVPAAVFERTARHRLSGDEYARFISEVPPERPIPFKDLEPKVVYYPEFDDEAELGNHFGRAAWYLTGPGTPVQSVTMALAREGMTPAAPPEFFCEPTDDLSPIRFETDEEAYLADLRSARMILIWKSVPEKIVKMMRAKHPTAKIFTVCTDDVDSIEYGNYTKVQWTVLTNEERRDLLDESHQKLAKRIAEVRETGVQTAAVFGTGPSLDQAFEFDFSDTFTVACNTIINSPELLEHVKPAFLCAGDVVSHFGVSTYAAKFREDLVHFLRNSDCIFFTTSDFGFLMLSKHPDLRDSIIMCQQTANGPIVDLLETFALPKLDSTLNIHMLPLASTVADTVFILGCDGKDPDPEKNEDFWNHSQLAQYHDLVETGHQAHPTFDMRRQAITHTRFVDSTEGSLSTGEFMGRRYYCLKPSFTPSLKSRPVPPGMLEEQPDGKLKLLAANRDCAPLRADAQRVLITARVNPNNFSGGRYHAFLMAEALAMSGHQVTMWVDNVPKWYFNLALLPGHPNIKIHMNYFTRPPSGRFDWVFVTPDFSDAPDLYTQSLQLAKAQSAKVGLINFESPNWFNEWVDHPRPASRWRHWLTTANFADVIISSADVSSVYAKVYYNQVNDHLTYVTVPPAINSGAGDFVRAKGVEKEDRIVCISRFGKDAAHKNIEGILPLLSDATRGYTLALIVGTGDLPNEEEEEALRAQFREFGVELELLHNISDIEKFEVIGRSKLMIFQSLFEGFGYPPIEAQYVDCQCVAYDLPVLREFSDEHVNFVEHGNPEAMRLAIADVLRGDHVTPTELYPNVADLGSVEGFARRIQSALFDNTAIAGGQVRKFRRDMFLHLSEQYEQYKDAIHRSDDTVMDIDPGSFAGILAKHFRALADELAEKSASGK